jgi:hypothetical protein
MNLTRFLTALTICAVSAVVAVSPAQAVSPVKGGVECHMKVKKSFRLGAVLKRGLPVNATCTGPARFHAILDFPAMSKQANDLLLRFPGGLPGITTGDGPTALQTAGTGTARVRLTPWAAKIAKRYPKTKLIVIFVVEREDGRFTSIPAENERTVLIR